MNLQMTPLEIWNSAVADFRAGWKYGYYEELGKIGLLLPVQIAHGK